MNTTHSSPLPIQQLVDRQIKEWEIQKRTRRSDPGKTPIDHHEFVTISRTLGSGGNDIAHLLGQQIGWPVIDNEIIQVMARDDDTRERLYDSLDERDRGWVEDFLHTILDRDYHWNDYFKNLVETVASISRQGQAIFLGRGADLILPKHIGLRIRVVAPEQDRLR
ncbi:MAG: cytidylate kinase family protein, partial [Planctomycetota bacterium]|nr:cytidylate kinase family protein [Planctomycetota bacterium]